MMDEDTPGIVFSNNVTAGEDTGLRRSEFVVISETGGLVADDVIARAEQEIRDQSKAHGPAMSKAPATYPQLRAAMSKVIAERDAAVQECRRLQKRASTLEDAVFHFQSCATCAQDGESSCISGRVFAAFLRGEEMPGD